MGCYCSSQPGCYPSSRADSFCGSAHFPGALTVPSSHTHRVHSLLVGPPLVLLLFLKKSNHHEIVKKLLTKKKKVVDS